MTACWSTSRTASTTSEWRPWPAASARWGVSSRSVITIGAGLPEPGHATRTDRHEVGFKIGELDGQDTPRARALVEMLCDAAPTKLTTNLFGERWSKLATNCMANALAGLSGYGSREIRTQQVPRRIAIQIAAEVIRVGRASGYKFEPIFGISPQRFVDAADGKGGESLEAEMAEGASKLADGRPSLLQDVLRGRRTEVDDLNGYVVRTGQRLGVDTPFNEAIVHEINRHGVGTLRPSPENLEPLVKLLQTKQQVPS
jgi:2-dehydropantoate 2-reductase